MAAFQTIESIQQAALALQPDARAQLAHTLVESLDSLSDAELSELWLSEAERRDAEMESGHVAGISGEKVLGLIKARYGK